MLPGTPAFDIADKPLCFYYDGEYREDDAGFEPRFQRFIKSSATSASRFSVLTIVSNCGIHA